MAKTNGIEKLRNVMEHWRTGSLVDWCRGIAYQIEREHQDALNERIETICELNREIDQLRADLAEAKRDMTDEAREVVERLRSIGEECLGMKMLLEILCALGISDASIIVSISALRDRLIELIEHGGKQDVDVVGLLELARRVESTRGEEDDPCRYFGRYHKPCGDCPAYHDDCGKVMLGDIAESIRKAIDGAPEQSNIVALCKPCRTNRDAAADWVEQQGGLDVVRDYPKMDEFVAKLAIDLGVSDDIGCGDDLRLAISEELGKRLMPNGMNWPPKDGDGEDLHIGDKAHFLRTEYDGDHEWDDVITAFRHQGIEGEGDIWIVEGEHGEAFACECMVKRPDPEVLGADGLPIKVGETVYALQGEDPLIVSGYDGEFLKIKSGGLLRADYATHTPPDTQERIDEEAKLEPCEYSCTRNLCAHGEDCHGDWEAEARTAMIADLLRRQRELDARTMGGAE